MPLNRLNVIHSPSEVPKKPLGRSARRLESQEKFEHLWRVNPKQFNPERSARERERIGRTWNLILSRTNVKHSHVVDLPCGWGSLAVKLCEAGAQVHAADVSETALRHVENGCKNECTTSLICLPHTTLKEDGYDLVISTDAISYLAQDDYRLYFAELSRIVKSDGHVVCSTNIDIYSEDALKRFCELFETEFEIEDWIFSYHAYQIRLCNVLEAPSKFIKAAQDADYRNQEINNRRAFNRFWFKWNSTLLPSFFWRTINLAVRPLYNWIKQSRKTLLFLERFCRFFSAEEGISHAILLGKRRPLFALPPENPPIERKHKREVWE